MPHVVAAVREIVSKYETTDPAKIARELGLVIRYERIPVYSLSMLINSAVFLILNADMDPNVYSYWIAAAIGHLVLHPGSGKTNEIQDDEANRFANLLLCDTAI